MDMPWPTISDQLHLKGIAKIDVLLKEVAGALENDRITDIHIDHTLSFHAKMPIRRDVGPVLAFLVGAGEIRVEQQNGWWSLLYRVSWRRGLIYGLACVGLLILMTLMLWPRPMIMPYVAWFLPLLGAVMTAHSLARTRTKCIMRACIRRAGGVPLRNPPEGSPPAI